MLENLYFDFKIEPAMCTLSVDKAASTEMKTWTATQRGASILRNRVDFSFAVVLGKNDHVSIEAF